MMQAPNREQDGQNTSQSPRRSLYSEKKCWSAAVSPGGRKRKVQLSGCFLSCDRIMRFAPDKPGSPGLSSS